MTPNKVSWMDRLPDLGAVIKRFPIAIVIMGCVTFYYILFGFDSRNDAANFAVTGAIVSAYLAMMQTLWAEARDGRPNWLLQILMSIGLAVLFYFSEKLRLNVAMLVVAVLLIIGNSARLGRTRDDLHVWDFTHKIWTAAGFAALGSTIYYLGVWAIMNAFESLFGVNIERLIVHLILPTGLVFLAPLYWLSNIPPVDDPTDYLNDNPSFVSKAVAFLGTWVLSPLTLIYALIILAYALKILLQMELPKGEIAVLTTPFLIIGTLTWLLLEPPFIQKNMLAQIFRKFWFVLSVPAAMMLSISVGVRVGAYGLTEQRVLLILAVVWSLGLAGWFIFAPTARRDIRIIPALAAVLLLAAAPMIHHVSIASQSARFERAVADMKVAEKGDLKPAVAAKGALQYLWRNEAEDNARRIVRAAGYKVSDKAKHSEIREILDLDTVKTRRRHRPNDVARRVEKYIYNAPSKSIYVAGYDYIFGGLGASLNKKRVSHLTELEDGIIKIENGIIIIYQGDTELGRFDLKTWVDSLELAEGTILVPENTPILYEDANRRLALYVKSMKRNVTNGDIETASGNIKFHILSKGFTPKP